MGKIQDLYESRVKPMVPAERLQLARLILDDLAPSDSAVDIKANQSYAVWSPDSAFTAADIILRALADETRS